MLLGYFRILGSFHKTFLIFILILVLYEGLQIVEGYSISLVIKLFEARADFYIWAGLLVFILIFDEAFMRLDNRLNFHIITKHSYPIYKFLKLASLKKFLELDVSWHQRNNSGALVGKVSNGVEKVLEISDQLSWEFVPTFVQITLSLIPLLIFSPVTALISIVAFCLFMYLSVKGNNARKPLRKSRYDLFEHEWHRSIEVVQAHETSLMFGQTHRLMSEAEKLMDDISWLGNEEARIGIYKYNKIRIRCLTISRRAIFAIWVWQLYSGTMDIAGLVFVSILTEKLFHSFWRFARLLDRTSEASEAAARLINLLNEQPPEATGSFKLSPKTGVSIKLENVNFSYQDGRNEAILSEFDLDIREGVVLALVGPSGAGKTTIRKLITGLIPVQEGRVLVNGIDIKDWDKENLLSLFSYVPQGDDVFIFSGNLKDNIAFGKPDASLDEIIQAANLSGIHEFIMSLPDGYDTIIGERGKKLSGGQKQRIALSRAVLADKPVLILDEATSSVDAITEAEIQAKMRKILEGKTAIIIAHRLATVWDIAEKIVVLDQGRKIEEGTHDQLIESGGLYAKMVVLQTA